MTARPARPPDRSPSPEPMSPLLLTTSQVAALLQVSRWWVYDHGEDLGRVDLGGRHRYLRERVEEYLLERASRPPERRVTSASPRQSSRRKPARRVRLLEPATDSRPESGA